jgi:hypothetical protein
MNDINDVRKAVCHISPDQAEETQGVWIAPDGNTGTQCKQLLEKSVLWADQMCTGVIGKDENWLALQSTIWKTFCYPLNANNLTRSQCESIMSPVINYALPAMGVCRNFPRALVYSPTKYKGLGIKHIHTLQEIAHLKDLLQHTYMNSTTGQLYHISLEYLILEVGIDSNLTSVDFNTYKMLATNSLIKNTWEFLQKNNIFLDHNIKVPPNTQYDKPLMPEFLKLNPTKSELEALNQCRLYLQAYYILDLATASGCCLSAHAWEGKTREMATPTGVSGHIKAPQGKQLGLHGKSSLRQVFYQEGCA